MNAFLHFKNYGLAFTCILLILLATKFLFSGKYEFTSFADDWENIDRFVIAIFLSQVTILALVFPLAMQTVNMFSSDKPHLQNRTKIYLKESNAFYTALSVLTLAIASVLLYLSTASDSSVIKIIVISILSLSAIHNLFNVGAFLFFTSEFLDHKKQPLILRSYLAKNAIPVSTNDVVTQYLWQKFTDTRLKIELNDFSKKYNLKFDTDSIATLLQNSGINKEVRRGTGHLKRAKFGTIIAISKLTLLEGRSSNEEIRNYLKFDLSTGASNSQLEVKTNLPIDEYKRRLLRTSVKFSDTSSDSQSEMYRTILNESKNNVLLSLRENKIHSFELAIEEFCMLIKFGYIAFSIPELKSNIVYFRTNWFQSSLYDDWRKSIVEISQEVSNHIPQSDDYFKTVADHFSCFHSDHIELMNLTISSLYSLGLSLITTSPNDTNNDGDSYIDCTEKIVGHFLAIQHALKNIEFSWGGFRDKYSNLYFEYISAIGRLTCRAAQYEKRELFSEWESLAHSVNVSDLLEYNESYWIEDSTAATLIKSSLDTPVEELIAQVSTLPNFDNYVSEEQIAAIILKNYQSDTNLIIATAILERSWRVEENFDLKFFVSKFLQEYRWENERFHGEGSSAPDIAELKAALIRVTLFATEQNDLSGINKFSRHLGAYYEESMIGWRMYNTGPNYSGLSLKAHLTSIIYKASMRSGNIFDVTSFQKLLLNFPFDPYNYRMIEFFRRCVSELEKVDEYRNLYCEIETNPTNRLGLAIKHRIALENFTSLIEKMENYRAYAVAVSPISNTKIEKIQSDIIETFDINAQIELMSAITNNLQFVNTHPINQTLHRLPIERKHVTSNPLNDNTSLMWSHYGPGLEKRIFQVILYAALNNRTCIELECGESDAESVVYHCSQLISQNNERGIVLASNRNSRALNTLINERFAYVYIGDLTQTLNNTIIVIPEGMIDSITINGEQNEPKISFNTIDDEADPIVIEIQTMLNVVSKNQNYFRINVV